MSARVIRHAVALAVAALALPGIAFASSLSLTSQNLTIYKTCALTAYPSASATEIDSYVDQAIPNVANGNATTLSVESLSGGNRRIYIRFDLTKCNPAPTNAVVKKATLRLYVSALATSCRTLDIFASTGALSENVKWNNQTFGTTTNNPASNTRTDFIQVGATSCANSTLNAYVTGWNVTADLARFVAGTATNNGWMIRDDTENSATPQLNTFSSREAAVLAQAPQLFVTYTI